MLHENNPPNWTHSKFYGEMRSIDSPGYYGATGSLAGNNYGAFMFVGNRETSSGGPFYKDIDFQTTGAAVELYNYTFSGHTQTENFRPGLKGPFALQFTDGSAPMPVDYSFINSLPVTGLVGPAGRGAVTGVASGVPAGYEVVVGLSNTADQYWSKPDGAGNYTISGVLPGTYTETLYRGELAVATRSVTVTAGNTTSSNIAQTFVDTNAIWRIGRWDGTPLGFLNADKIGNMHPSDPRLSPWVNQNFVVGTNTDADFLMAQFKDATLNNTQTITFNLTAQQVQAMQLRIGITVAQAGGRPIISVNNGSFSTAQAASTQPSTRSITLGNWRGNNFTYSYNIAASALHAGTNNIRIQIASGSSSSSPYLQPTDVYDAIELNPTIPAAPTGLVAQSISDHEIDLVTWNPAPGATSYNVKRSPTSGGPYTTIATGVTSTNYQDPTLNPATNYFYVVSAVNGAGEGLNSSQATAQTRTAAPTGLTATAVSISEIDLDWDDTVGATSYTVMRASVSGGPYSTIATGVSSSNFSDTTVSSGTAYFYVVVANDSGGPSLASAEAMAVTAPAAPTSLSASTVSVNQIDLSWNGSVGATSYTIKRSDSLGGPYTFIDTTTTLTTYSDPTVQGAHRYYYVVSATGDGGESDNSNEAVATTPPLGASDSYSVDEDMTLDANDAAGTVDGTNDDGVLVNDSAAPGNVLTASLVDGPMHGTLTFNADGTFSYHPSANYNGGDSFTYIANDGQADSSVVTVNITVNPVNDAPVASNNTYNASQNLKLVVAAPGVLGNDTDVESDPLTAILVGGPSHGTLSLASDGSLVYTPDEDFIGTDTFTYKANDGSLDSNIATVQINVAAAVAGATLIPDPCGNGTAVLVQGTSGNDSIAVNPSGTAGTYVITLNGQSLGAFNVQRIILHGEAGNDTIQVSGSVATPVWMFGESGEDHLNAGNGGGVEVGGSGNDDLLGGGGRDVLIGGLGADHIVGNADDDILIAGRSDFDRNVDALCDVYDEWGRTDAGFITRVEHLKGTQAGGLNGATFLSSSTVHDDGATDQIDVLVGSSGDDWYIYDSASGDKANGISSLENNEAITNI